MMWVRFEVRRATQKMTGIWFGWNDKFNFLIQSFPTNLLKEVFLYLGFSWPHFRTLQMWSWFSQFSSSKDSRGPLQHGAVKCYMLSLTQMISWGLEVEETTWIVMRLIFRSCKVEMVPFVKSDSTTHLSTSCISNPYIYMLTSLVWVYTKVTKCDIFCHQIERDCWSLMATWITALLCFAIFCTSW